MFDALRNAIRSPLNWAAARGLCKKVDFNGPVLPEKSEKKRGLLTDEEIARLLALPTQQLWRETMGKNNYVRGDGDKDPKADSFGTIPLAPELEVVFWELKELAKALGLDAPDYLVLFDPGDPTKPASESTLRRGGERCMRMIGISDAERKRRNLVPHGTRHRFATKLAEAGIDPKVAQEFTRHRTLAMFERYAAHLSAETIA